MVTSLINATMKRHLFVILLILFASSNVIFGNISDIQVIDAKNDPVTLYSTAIIFRLTVKNKARVSYNVTISWQSCCLDIDVNDTDCEIMVLSSLPQTVVLGPVDHGNNTDTAVFNYRNLYARYRKGNCTFDITLNEGGQIQHIIKFNTTPTTDVETCQGLDQDPDRECTPVDCAIKYKGKRNYYRHKTGKCEPVVPCNTRGSDGFSVTGYYDWEENVCVQYKWFDNDNYYQHIESDTEIPAEIDQSSKLNYYSELEPNLPQEPGTLVCNHGIQNGTYCICDKGWISSGIHKNNPLLFRWCDTPEAITSEFTADGNILPFIGKGAPRTLTKWQELAAIISLGLVNVLLFCGIVYTLYVLFQPYFNKMCSSKSRNRKKI